MLESILNRPVISRTRRNHALEHATIHLLSARHPQATLVGRSDPRGFYLFGDVPSEAVVVTAQEALQRLAGGERRLSIHPNCGTNLMTTAVLGGLAAFVSLAGRSGTRRRVERLPTAIFVTLLGVLIAQPLGTALQRSVTTQADPMGMRITEVKTWRRGRVTLHRVVTAG